MRQDTKTRLIFGIKVQMLRKSLGLSFADLSEVSGLSISYLNEIEKGKKYPKEDKLALLAPALNTSIEHLTSLVINKQLQPLVNILENDTLSMLPLEIFGIDVSKIIEIIASSPAEVGAFIAALVEISKRYEMHEEGFYFAMLRAYQTLFDNYFGDLELQVDDFKRQFLNENEVEVSVKRLSEVLRHDFKYKIDKSTIGLYAELKGIRSIFIQDKKRLLVNHALSENQERFIYAKEIAYKVLKIKERINTSAFSHAETFDQAHNNFKTSYFAVALLLHRETLVKDMAEFFALPNWTPSSLLAIMEKHKASPEMFFQRLTNLLPKFFNTQNIFFLRINNQPGSEKFLLTKELHLYKPQRPYGQEINEHYCRRWLALSILKELYAKQRANPQFNETLVGIQRSRYIGTTDEYLVLTLAKSGHPTPNMNISVSIGILINQETKDLIRWVEDEAIQRREVNQTCQRCAVSDCNERIAAPLIIEKENRAKGIQEILNSL